MAQLGVSITTTTTTTAALITTTRYRYTDWNLCEDDFEPGQNFQETCKEFIPSNGAFIGHHNPRAIELFDAAGNFTGKKIITVLGSMVWDAGTEWNTEMDAAFLNQSAGDTGVTTMAPIMPHPGFLGSYGNPGSPWLVLGSTNAAGTMIDPVGGDFSVPYAVVARITVDWVPAPPPEPDPAMIPGGGGGQPKY